MADTVVGVHYRPAHQEEEVDEAFYRQLEVASKSQDLVLMGGFNHPDVCWKDCTAMHKQFRSYCRALMITF